MRHGSAEGLEPTSEDLLRMAGALPPTLDMPHQRRPDLRLVARGERTVKVKPAFYLDDENGEWVLELQCRFPADTHHQSEAWALAAAATAACHDVLAGESNVDEDLPDMVMRELNSPDDP